MKKKVKRKMFTINFFNILILVTVIVTSALLIHDFIFWGIVPMFTGTFYTVTYFGMFLDLMSILALEVSLQYTKEWF